MINPRSGIASTTVDQRTTGVYPWIRFLSTLNTVRSSIKEMSGINDQAMPSAVAGRKLCQVSGGSVSARFIGLLKRWDRDDDANINCRHGF